MRHLATRGEDAERDREIEAAAVFGNFSKNQA